MNRRFRQWRLNVILLLVFAALPAGAGEVVLQYFNTAWPELTRRIPELAEAGYTALWLPPPFKAGGGLSVGFDTYDRFDLGSKDKMVPSPRCMVPKRNCFNSSRWRIVSGCASTSTT